MQFSEALNQQCQTWVESISHISQDDVDIHAMRVGKVVKMTGLSLTVTGLQLPIGSRCIIERSNAPFYADVVGFSETGLFLMPVDSPKGVALGDTVRLAQKTLTIPDGDGLLGRVIDALGEPIDQRGPLIAVHETPIASEAINPLHRSPISEPFDVGIKAINSMLTLGVGQRVGLLAGSGVGKSELLAMMSRFSQADVAVIGLIGERGREVQEFIQKTLGKAALKKTVIVTEPADASARRRVLGAQTASAIAQNFSKRGKRVLLLMDSLTRFAQAQREVGLAIGEMPATKGYPPSVFAEIASIVEQAGTDAKSGGAVTAIYTVLSEGDDLQDPVVDSARAILDGHIVLTRELADSGHYPAIDINQSVSRVMSAVQDDMASQTARQVKFFWGLYQDQIDMIRMRAIQPGADPEIDRAMALYPALRDYFQQPRSESFDLQSSQQLLQQILTQQAPQIET